MADSERRLAAIMVGDIVGYSAMMGRDEAGTLSKVFAFHTQLLGPTVTERRGRIVKTTGDGFLAEFPSVVEAVEAGITMQTAIWEWPEIDEQIALRIGVHLGDVVVRDGDIYGDGVNIAARLEQASEPGGILISAAVHEHLAGRDLGVFEEAGDLTLKNIDRPVAAWRWSPSGERAASAAKKDGAGKPTIAVLPFDNQSGDSEQDYLADGIVQDVITSLSRFPWFKVIARASSFAFRGQGLSALEVGERLGAQFLLEGSVRRSGDRIRVTAELIDAQRETQVWGERFDGTLEDVFELQDQIVGGIVGTVVPHFVMTAGTHRSATAPSLTSWELAMRGWNLAWRLDGEEDTLLAARRYFEDAIEADPNNALAFSGLAFSFGNPFYLAGLERDAQRALTLARTAVELDPRDALAWCLVGAAEMWSGELDDAERHVKRAAAINPNLALAHMYMASICSWRADLAATEAWADQAEELSPADPMLPFTWMSRAMARFAHGDYRGALTLADQVIAVAPELPSSWRIRAASLELLGDHEGAQAAIERLQSIRPISVAWARTNLTPFTDPEKWDRYLSALESAGLPAE